MKILIDIDCSATHCEACRFLRPFDGPRPTCYLFRMTNGEATVLQAGCRRCPACLDATDPDTRALKQAFNRYWPQERLLKKP